MMHARVARIREDVPGTAAFEERTSGPMEVVATRGVSPTPQSTKK
jgi:hypothetical protein